MRLDLTIYNNIFLYVWLYIKKYLYRLKIEIYKFINKSI